MLDDCITVKTNSSTQHYILSISLLQHEKTPSSSGESFLLTQQQMVEVPFDEHV